jgi:hypothetical protein
MKWSSLVFVATLLALSMVGIGPAQARPDAALTGTYWRAVEISGTPIDTQTK